MKPSKYQIKCSRNYRKTTNPNIAQPREDECTINQSTSFHNSYEKVNYKFYNYHHIRKCLASNQNTDDKLRCIVRASPKANESSHAIQESFQKFNFNKMSEESRSIIKYQQLKKCIYNFSRLYNHSKQDMVTKELEFLADHQNSAKALKPIQRSKTISTHDFYNRLCQYDLCKLSNGKISQTICDKPQAVNPSSSSPSHVMPYKLLETLPPSNKRNDIAVPTIKCKRRKVRGNKYAREEQMTSLMMLKGIQGVYLNKKIRQYLSPLRSHAL